MAVEPQRIKGRTLIDTSAAQHAIFNALSEELRTTLVRRMERSCHEVTIEHCTEDGTYRGWSEPKFTQRYSTHCARIAYNLAENPDLIARVIASTIDPYNIARLAAQDLWPEASSVEREAISVRQNQAYERKVSTAHRCFKCGKSETIPQKYRGRAADEDDNTSIKCMNCGNIWQK